MQEWSIKPWSGRGDGCFVAFGKGCPFEPFCECNICSLRANFYLKWYHLQTGVAPGEVRSMLAPRRKVKNDFSEIFGIYTTLKTIF